MRMIKKIKDFIKGFFKVEINKDFKLPEAPEKLGVDINSILRITNVLDQLPINQTSLRYGLKSLNIEKVTNHLLKHELLSKNEPIQMVKVNTEYFRSEKRKEFLVTNYMYVLGIDAHVWKITFTSFLICTVYTQDFDTSLIDCCTEFSNGVLKYMQLQNMVAYKDELTFTYLSNKEDVLQTRHFEGYVKTYGSSQEFNTFNLTDVLDPMVKNNATIIQDAVFESSIDDKIDKTSMFLPVYRAADDETNISLSDEEEQRLQQLLKEFVDEFYNK